MLTGQLDIFSLMKQNNDSSSNEKKPLKIYNKVSSNVVEHTEKFNDLTINQKSTLNNFISKYKVVRAIKSGKSLELEIITKEGFVAYWIDKSGNEEFHFNKRASILPWDKVIYYSKEFQNPSLTKIQEKHYNEFLNESDTKKIKRVIHRKGDLNILIEYSGKIIDILPNGWVLEFNNINHIDCMEDEIVTNYLNKKNNVKVPSQIVTSKIEVEVGDLVQALHGTENIEGRITRKYGMDNDILNIEFKRGNSLVCTAIGRRHVIKILSSAAKQ